MTKKRIKLVARNPLTRTLQEVFPEDEFDPREAFPLFLSKDGHYYAIPGQTTIMVWAEWLAQF